MDALTDVDGLNPEGTEQPCENLETSKHWISRQS